MDRLWSQKQHSRDYGVIWDLALVFCHWVREVVLGNHLSNRNGAEVSKILRTPGLKRRTAAESRLEDSMSRFPFLHWHEAPLHSFSDASAAHSQSDAGRYYSVWDLTIQVTSHMINPDLFPSQGKDTVSAKFRGLLSRQFSDSSVVDKVWSEMRKMFPLFIHSAVTMCVHLSSLSIDASPLSEHASWATFFFNVMLSNIAWWTVLCVFITLL